MLKIYFDNILIDEDSYTALGNDYKLFTDKFKLGSVACNSFKLSVNKNVISSQPNEVRIEDDNTTFYLVVDSVVEDKYTYTYTLTDKLLNFNFNYDASEIINEKIENEEVCYLSDIWKDMCNRANVEYDDTYLFTNDIEVNWYDNTIQARKYLSYIAELQGGYACILENGKQSFKPYKKGSIRTVDIDECSDFILGEKKKITRVVYDTGVTKWVFGDDSGSTVYLDTTNVFITDETVVENIFNMIVDFEFYLVDVPDAPIDSSVRAGDIIVFTDGVNNYPTIAQYSMSYGGGWIGGYSLKVATDKQEETKVNGVDDNIKKIQSDIDRTNATLKITAEQTNKNTSQISTMEVTSARIEQMVKTTGGSNQIKDSSALFGLSEELWIKEGNVTGGYDQSLIGRCVTPAKINIQNGKITSTQKNIENLIIGSTYTLSFLLINDVNTTLKLKLIGNNELVNLEANTKEDLKEYAFNFVANTDKLTLEIESESLYSGSSSVVDLMLNLGEKKPHELASGEINGASMQTSTIGTVFRNVNADTATLVNSDGFDVREYRNNQIGNIITDFKKDGMNTKKIGCTEIKLQKLIKKKINSSGREMYIEYIEGS